jgi:hypothetical protein
VRDERERFMMYGESDVRRWSKNEGLLMFHYQAKSHKSMTRSFFHFISVMLRFYNGASANAFPSRLYLVYD